MEETTIHCAGCGKIIEPENEYCVACATRMLTRCPECGELICECKRDLTDELVESQE